MEMMVITPWAAWAEIYYIDKLTLPNGTLAETVAKAFSAWSEKPETWIRLPQVPQWPFDVNVVERASLKNWMYRFDSDGGHKKVH